MPSHGLMERADGLRRLADAVVGPTADGYLRPWMCDGRPAESRVLLIGANPATPFPTSLVRRDAYLDALVGDGRSLRGLYDAARAGPPSPTRRHIGFVVGILRDAGAGPVPETNAWTLPTPGLADLRASDPALVARPSEVVPRLVELLRPAVLIVHGAKATGGLAGLLGRPIEPSSFEQPVGRVGGEPVIFTLPSLSPPPANRWLPRSTDALRTMATEVARLVPMRSGGPGTAMP